MTVASHPDLTIRLANCDADIIASQQLRYRVFYEELSAVADQHTRQSQRDHDKFDAVCDHLLVVQSGAGDGQGIPVADGILVGTYRLLRQDVADRNFGFYTQGEFDIAALIARKPDLRFLELGRSCVLKAHRSKPVVELLWQGIWNYVRAHRMDVMLGCASLEGTDPAQHADSLSFLAHFAAPQPDWAVKAHDTHSTDMAIKPKTEVDQKRALRNLPPLIKGYLRLGCSIGDGAVIDRQFNTIDVLIILPVAHINPRYFAHFGQPSG